MRFATFVPQAGFMNGVVMLALLSLLPLLFGWPFGALWTDGGRRKPACSR